MNQLDKCSHPKTSVKKTINPLFYYCTFCGILAPLESSKIPSLTKPVKYYNKTEEDPLEYLQKLFKSFSQKIKEIPHISKLYLSERKSCINLLKNLCSYFGIKTRAFFSSLSYLDSVMTKYSPKDIRDIYLIVIVCVLLSNKFCQEPFIPITLESIIKVNTHFQYSKKEIIEKEIQVLKLIDYNLQNPNIYEVLTAFLNCGVVFKEEEKKGIEIAEKVYSFCYGALLKLIYSQIFFIFDNYVIAFSLIFLARKYYDLSKDNLKILKDLFQLEFKQYRDCAVYIKE